MFNKSWFLYSYMCIFLQVYQEKHACKYFTDCTQKNKIKKILENNMNIIIEKKTLYHKISHFIFEFLNFSMQ